MINNWWPYGSALDVINKKLDRVLTLLGTVQGEEVRGMKELDDLKANVAALQDDVAKENTVIDSAVTLLQGQTKMIADIQAQLAVAIAANDPAAIQAAADALKAQNDAIIAKTADLAAAVQANTPASPTS